MAALRGDRARLLTVVIFLAMAAWYVAFAVERYDSSHLYGDEPEYFFGGQSVWDDGDLDLRNQFENPDRHAFPGPLTFKLDPAGGPSPANFMPTDGVVLVQPANALGGLLAAYLLFAAMNLASLLLLFVVLRRIFPEVVAAVAIGVTGLTVPLAWHAASLWTEVPALLGLSAIFALGPRIGCSARAAAGVALILAALPWLHQKYFTLAFGVSLALLLPAARRRFWPLIAAAPWVGLATTVAFSLALRDRWNFTISGTTADASSAFNGSVNRFLRQPIAWFFDATRGSLPLAPVWILAGVGLLFLLRFARGRKLLVTMLVAFAPFFVVYFWGPFLAGDSPPGRETLPAIPALALLMAAGIHALRGWLATSIAAVLGAVSVWLATTGPFRHGFDIMFNNVGRPKLLDAISTPRFRPGDLWPQMTATPGLWSGSALLLTGIAAGALMGLVYEASRARAATGRPWTLAGEAPERWSVAGARRAVTAALPRAVRRGDRSAP